MLRNAVGGGRQISWKKRYGDVRFNVFSVARGWVGHRVSNMQGEIALRNSRMAPYGFIAMNPKRGRLPYATLRG